MNEFWEDKFQEIGLLWTFEPADSAIFSRDLFVKNGFRKIMIPGVDMAGTPNCLLKAVLT